jgi:hypothetical protein
MWTNDFSIGLLLLKRLAVDYICTCFFSFQASKDATIEFVVEAWFQISAWIKDNESIIEGSISLTYAS